MAFERYDDMTDVRFAQIAEWFRGGAELVDGTLYPTAEQKDRLQYEHELGVEAGRLVLYSAVDEAASKTAEDILQAEANREKLMVAIADVTEPYSGIFDERIPSPSGKDKNLLGHLKKKVAMQPWQETREFDNATVRYRFKGHYTPGERINLPGRVAMDIYGTKSVEKRMPGICQKVEYRGGNVQSVDTRLHNHDSSLVSFSELTAGEAKGLEGFLKGIQASYNPAYKIVFNDQQITITGTHGFDHKYAYTYNPDKDAFFRGPEGSGLMVDRIDVPAFLGLLKDTLALIPTKALKW